MPGPTRQGQALLVLLAGSLGLLIAFYTAGTSQQGPVQLVDYSVLPGEVTEMPSMAQGVSDEDMSPKYPKSLEKEEEKSIAMFKRLQHVLKKSEKMSEGMNIKVDSLKEYVDKEVKTVASDVKKMNLEDTDQITAIEPIQGPKGPPGPPGLNGLNGVDGPAGPRGEQGSRGGTGVQGNAGPTGPLGAEGTPGRFGDAGPAGSPGVVGEGGLQGPAGVEGLGDGWQHTKFDCPEAATETMRMVHCNRMGCRLETYFAGQWGTICGRNFAADNAKTLCNAFGFPAGGKSHTTYGEFTKRRQIWLTDVNCVGSEGDVGDCNHAPWGVAVKCKHKDDVGLCCFGSQFGELGVRVGPSDFDKCREATSDFARLVDCGYKSCRVEVNHEDEWGTVCDSGFTDKSAGVLCRSLGFSVGGVARRAGGGQGQIWMSDVTCKGDEKNLELCPHTAWGLADCDHSMDAGVCCLGKQAPAPPKAKMPVYQCAGGKESVSSGSTRLVECTKLGCRLEVKHSDQWGTVCSSGFTEINAKVVCRSLGLPGGKYVDNYGQKARRQGFRNIWMSNTKCNGGESWVGSCRHDTWGSNSCGHDQDVGICCEVAWPNLK